MNRVQVLAAVLVVGLVWPLRGATINSNTIISAENSFPGEVVLIEDGESPPTVVQMIDGGEAQRMQLSGASILNIQGGRVAESVYAMGTSSVNIRGGEIGSLTVSRGSSSANVFGGAIEREVWVSSSQGIATLNLFDGQLGDVVGSGGTFPFAINIHGGHMGWIRVSSSMSTSVLNITGGSFDRFSPRGQMTVDWSGGEPRAGYLYLWDDSTLNIYGRGLELHYVLGDEFLSGTLLDGTVLHDISISRRITNAQVNLHNVPEPSSLGLAVLMVAPLLIRRGADRVRPFLAPRLLALALLAGFATRVGAVTIDYDTIISAENSFPGESVVIRDGESPPTVVQMIDGGEVDSILLTGTSILNFDGGIVTSHISAREGSTANIRGGSTQNLSVRDNATVNIFGGTIESEVRLSTGVGTHATLNIFDGLIRGNVFPDSRSGILNIHGGEMGTLFGLSHGSSIVNISGGSLEFFRVDGATTVHWSGGVLRGRGGALLEEAILHIYGRDLSIEDLDRDKVLSGTLLDGMILEDYFFHTAGNSQIILHNVPEPAAFGLAVVGVAEVFVCWSARRRGSESSAIGDGVASYS